jgi:hypothetical protein
MSRINVRLSLALTLHTDGPQPAAEIEEKACQMGISRHALRKAATGLGVEPTDRVWRLPDMVLPFTPRGGRLRRIPAGEAARPSYSTPPRTSPIPSPSPPGAGLTPARRLSKPKPTGSRR